MIFCLPLVVLVMECYLHLHCHLHLRIGVPSAPGGGTKDPAQNSAGEEDTGGKIKIFGKPTEICCQEYIASLEDLLLGADGLPPADGPAPMSIMSTAEPCWV